MLRYVMFMLEFSYLFFGI